MCSSYLSRPLRTEEQAIIDLIRSGSHVVVPREPTPEMIDAGRYAGGPAIPTIYRAMVQAGAITLTDRKQESD
ncbi:MAG TPA: hypothetical protein VIK75_10205 [Calditerricola sp.]